MDTLLRAGAATLEEMVRELPVEQYADEVVERTEEAKARETYEVDEQGRKWRKVATDGPGLHPRDAERVLECIHSAAPIDDCLTTH